MHHQQGGSITPEAAGVLDDLDRQGKLEVMTQADVVGAAWDWQQQRWDVWLEVSCYCCYPIAAS